MTERWLWAPGSTRIPWPPQMARCPNVKEKRGLGSYSSVDLPVRVIPRCLCKSTTVAAVC